MMLSEKILKFRKEKGLSQEELAEKLNVSRQAKRIHTFAGNAYYMFCISHHLLL